MVMNNTIELINKFFVDGDWKYDFKQVDDNRAMFITGINMNNAMGNLRIYVMVHETYYVVNAVINSTVEEKYYHQVAEYLHRANYGMRNGNFEMSFENGEVRYKTYVNFEGMQLSNEVITESILIPVFMFEKYGKNLLRLMLREEVPKELADEAENDMPPASDINISLEPEG